ncbi:MAG: preprotein translocase subunit YajC [Clostridia bacterium]|nr:preprotein translocase subunit YajC [Clostridia bacterium]
MDIWVTLGMVAVVVVVFYFFGIRPQKKQEQAMSQMRDNLQVGDEITTIGGIIGKIVSIKEETMIIETGRDHTRIRLLKTAVRNVDVRAEDARAAKQD